VSELHTGIPTRAVSNITGIAMPTLQYWVRSGLIIPSVRTRTASGRSMLWDMSDLVTLRIFAELRRQGCSVQKIRKAQDLIVERWGELVQSTVLTYEAGDVTALMDTGDLASALAQPGQQILSVMHVGQWAYEARAAALDHAVSAEVHDEVRKAI
jgi:DNA-binding transcriptional MerR regulator